MRKSYTPTGRGQTRLIFYRTRGGSMSCAARTVTEIRLNCVLKSTKLFRPAFKLSTFGALAHTRLYAPLFAQTL